MAAGPSSGPPSLGEKWGGGLLARAPSRQGGDLTCSPAPAKAQSTSLGAPAFAASQAPRFDTKPTEADASTELATAAKEKTQGKRPKASPAAGAAPAPAPAPKKKAGATQARQRKGTTASGNPETPPVAEALRSPF